ncbi:MAG: hypothetical protein M1826_004688 [Phylliscum demangeonii]|nr:MAG: hypothetical protein M1826_004688 [Phylliscum demangeonii]
MSCIATDCDPLPGVYKQTYHTIDQGAVAVCNKQLASLPDHHAAVGQLEPLQVLRSPRCVEPKCALEFWRDGSLEIPARAFRITHYCPKTECLPETMACGGGGTTTATLMRAGIGERKE